MPRDHEFARAGFRASRLRAALGLGLMCACACLGAPRDASAQGGPPLITDDPDTPGPRHWELNI